MVTGPETTQSAGLFARSAPDRSYNEPDFHPTGRRFIRRGSGIRSVVGHSEFDGAGMIGHIMGNAAGFALKGDSYGDFSNTILGVVGSADGVGVARTTH